MVFSAALGIGMRWVAELKNRLVQMGYLEKALTFLLSEISYENSSVPESLIKIGTRFPNSFGEQLIEMGEELLEKNGGRLEEIWIHYMDKISKQLKLKGYEAEEILQLGTVLGSADKKLQTDAIQGGLQMLREALKDENSKLDGKQKVSITLSIAGGFMTIILLI